MSQNVLSRRKFLARSALVGCSAAASPLLTPVSFASAPWDTRLVVIILRGAMDGLDVVQPYGRPGLAAHRATMPLGPEYGATDLDGFFALNAGLAQLLPLWHKGELAFVHATSTPYRDKRSHFDGQDILENGAARAATGVRGGWLNRAIANVPESSVQSAYAIGQSDLLLMSGDQPVSEWAPEAAVEMSAQTEMLMRGVMSEDPLCAAVYEEVLRLSEIEKSILDQTNKKASMEVKLASFAASRLKNEARIAAFSINGWDMHANQANRMHRHLPKLSTAIQTLHDDLGPDIWAKTAVLAMTEFGRTVQENGTKGTDHGTAGAMVLAGGAINGGKVFGTWPGLTEADLYKRRDLMPTTDVRAHTAWIMRGLMGLDRATLENTVFPGLDMGDSLGLLL